MNFIEDKLTGFKSLAVWLPTLATIIMVILDAVVQANIIPTAYVPIVVFISGYLGRIVKQPKLRE